MYSTPFAWWSVEFIVVTVFDTEADVEVDGWFERLTFPEMSGLNPFLPFIPGVVPIFSSSVPFKDHSLFLDVNGVDVDVAESLHSDVPRIPDRIPLKFFVLILTSPRCLFLIPSMKFSWNFFRYFPSCDLLHQEPWPWTQALAQLIFVYKLHSNSDVAGLQRELH